MTADSTDRDALARVIEPVWRERRDEITGDANPPDWTGARRAADAVLAHLRATGPARDEGLPEWECPSCGATTRARMADHEPARDVAPMPNPGKPTRRRRMASVHDAPPPAAPGGDTAPREELREQLRDILVGWPIGSGYYQTSVGNDEALEMSVSILEALAARPVPPGPAATRDGEGQCTRCICGHMDYTHDGPCKLCGCQTMTTDASAASPDLGTRDGDAG